MANLRAMICLDSLGATPTKIWVSHSDPGLVDGLRRVAAALNVSLSGVNFERVGDTDSTPYNQRKIPTLTLHSLTQETLPMIHSSRDRLDAVKADAYYDSYRLISLCLAYLDATLP